MKRDNGKRKTMAPWEQGKEKKRVCIGCDLFHTPHTPAREEGHSMVPLSPTHSHHI